MCTTPLPLPWQQYQGCSQHYEEGGSIIINQGCAIYVFLMRMYGATDDVRYKLATLSRPRRISDITRTETRTRKDTRLWLLYTGCAGRTFILTGVGEIFYWSSLAFSTAGCVHSSLPASSAIGPWHELSPIKGVRANPSNPPWLHPWVHACNQWQPMNVHFSLLQYCTRVMYDSRP